MSAPSSIKAILKEAAGYLVALALLPQLFIWMYFFRAAFVRGGNWLVFVKDLFLCGWAMTRVGAPFLFLLILGVRRLNARRARPGLSFAAVLAGGYAMVAAWNIWVYPTFSYFWGAVPVAIMGGVASLLLLGNKLQEK